MKRKLISICLAAAMLLAACPLALAASESMEEIAPPEETTSPEDTVSPGGIASSEDSTLPTDSTELPSDGAELPSDGAELPPDDTELPSDGTELPPDDIELPSDGTELPPNDIELPSDGAELSPDDTELPSDGTELPPENVVNAPVISVSVPDQGRVIVNPYGLAVTLDGEESREQIVSGTYPVINNSEIPVAVSACATAYAPWPSEAVPVTAPPAPDTPQKEVFLFVEFQAGAYEWSGVYTGAPNQVPADGVSQREVLALETGGSGQFRLFGSAASSPEQMWVESDTVNVTLAFTFRPL